ncbi:hypothetical protein LZ32DRAFT_270212 [Colletotrichum eremochloae]|nr:hypothetical protein LZ32DRAFT_270212 [Colletotrichum eremochloae]
MSILACSLFSGSAGSGSKHAPLCRLLGTSLYLTVLIGFWKRGFTSQDPKLCSCSS